MTLSGLNEADGATAKSALLTCCSSHAWADGMLARRPFRNASGLFVTADEIWWSLQPNDWLEAFAAHPQIGEKKVAGWSSEEQRGLNGASAGTLDRLVEKNREYRRKFGFVFLICATGKTADEMLLSLNGRLQSERETELNIAAAEQAKIMRLRLEKLLDP